MENDRQLLRALAAVRPGLLARALRDIIGVQWREPLPHEEGKVLCLVHSHSFEAQIDSAGVVRRVRFGLIWSDPAFSSEVDIDGLRVGMSIPAARKAMPTLTITPGEHPMPTFGAAKRDDHTQLRLQFLFDELRVIEFVDNRAVYPAQRSTPFPAPADPPGAPFRDPNFKLVVMNALLDRRIIDLGKPGELAQFLLGRPFDARKEGYALLRPVYDYLVRYPLDQKHLDAVETLVFDGGNSIYHTIWPFWDGESNAFDVQHIDGIELCRNIREIHVLALLNETDFSLLDRLPKLQTRTGIP